MITTRCPGTRPVHDGAGTCHDGTADETGSLERHALVDDDSLRLAHDGALSEDPRIGELVGLGPADDKGLAETAHRVAAVRRLAAVTSVALAAVPERREDDVIAHVHLRRGAADLLDDPSAFVTEYDGCRERDSAVEYGNVGVTEPGSMNADTHLVRLDRPQLDVVADLQLARPDDRLHGFPPWLWLGCSGRSATG